MIAPGTWRWRVVDWLGAVVRTGYNGKSFLDARAKGRAARDEYVAELKKKGVKEE